MIKALIIIVSCIFVACSQDPQSSENRIGEVSGNVNFGANVSQKNAFEVRAYSYVSPGWHDNSHIRAASVSSDGSFTMKLPTGSYIFTLYNTQQHGPEFFYQFQHQFPCKTYELRLQENDSEELFANRFFSCEPEAMSVPDNGSLPGINFDIQDTGMISGSVIHADGTPFTQVEIKAFSCKTLKDPEEIKILGKYDTTLSAQTRPDAFGSYTICCLPKGDYILMTETDQQEYINMFYDNTYFRDQAKVITIDSGNEWNVNFKIRRGTTISGQIKSEDSPNAPIKGVLVTAKMVSTDYVVGRSIPSDINGNYAIYGLPQQNYILHANADHTVYQSCFYNKKYDNIKADPVDVNSTLPLIRNFDLQNQGRLQASIIDKNTNAAIKNNQIYVKIYHSSDLSLVDTFQSNNGVIIADLSEGDYKAEVITNGTPYASMFYSNENSLQNADDIPIINGKVNDTPRFKLQRGGSIRGYVVGQDCENPEYYDNLNNYTVIAFTRSYPSRIYQDKTDVFGKYQIDGLAEGSDYVVQVLTGDTSYLSEYYKQTYFLDTAENIEVDYDEITPSINFDLECGKELHGKVTNIIDNEPISGINIIATNVDKNTTYTATTNQNGLYVITGIPSGYEYSVHSAYEYTIHADASKTEFVSVDFANTIQFESDQKQREINFTLKKLPKISGIATCPTGLQFDYIINNITPGIYDFIVVDENNEEISRKEDVELRPNQEPEIFDFEL